MLNILKAHLDLGRSKVARPRSMDSDTCSCGSTSSPRIASPRRSCKRKLFDSLEDDGADEETQCLAAQAGSCSRSAAHQPAQVDESYACRSPA